MTRLIYDTAAGNLDEKGSFSQLIEYLTKCEEDAKGLARACKVKRDDVKAATWLQIADNFRRASNIVSHLATSRTKSGVGYAKG